MKANEVSEDAVLKNPSLTKAQDVAHTLQKARGGRRPSPAILKPPSPPGNPPGPAQTWEGLQRVPQPDLTKVSPQMAFNMRLPTVTADPSDHPLPQAHKSHPSLFFPGQDPAVTKLVPEAPSKSGVLQSSALRPQAAAMFAKAQMGAPHWPGQILSPSLP